MRSLSGVAGRPPIEKLANFGIKLGQTPPACSSPTSPRPCSDELDKVRMLVEHTGKQHTTLHWRHLRDVQRVERLRVELDCLRRLAVSELEHTQRRAPGVRVAFVAKVFSASL